MIQGCDDAETVVVERAAAPQRDVTFIYPYYENPEFLAKQAAVWANYPDALRAHLSVVVVDDGSPSRHAEQAIMWSDLKLHLDGRVRMFRIEVDVRWNWLAARNIGAKMASTEWILMTDMDHVVTEDALRASLCGRLDLKTIYRFSRVGTKTTPHPNSWLMTRDMFWRIGGYDESASGFYGTDGEYRRRCAAAAPVKILREALEHHEFEDDASTETYKRKQPQDAKGKAILRSRRGQKPKVLSFPYHEVSL